MTVKINIDGEKKLQAKLARMGRGSDDFLQDIIKIIALKIEGDAKIKIQTGGRTGLFYKRGTITHQASAPGEPPKTDTGQLVRNITAKVSRLLATIGSRESAPYGKWLEFGTGNILPRPWLRPTLNENRKFIKDSETRALKQFTQKVSKG